MENNWEKYIISFFITATVFFTAIYLGNYFNDKKLAEIRSIENKISMDILSSETQFDLLKEAPCENANNSILSKEIESLGEKLSYMEENNTKNDPEIIQLKKYYSMLEIKDYILANEFSKKCTVKPVSILYFYSVNCEKCQEEGYILSYIKEKYPEVRIYSFDYELDLSVIRTLSSMYKIGNKMPAFVIKNKTYNEFKSLEEIEKLLPSNLKATSTPLLQTIKEKIN